MGKKYTKNDAILSKYILDKTKEGHTLPYMTVMSKDLGISVATISRYARRKGFYSFADMRATFNKGLSKSSFNDFGIVDTIMDAEKVVIVASNFTDFLGEYVYARLRYLKKRAEIIRRENFDKEIKEIDDNALIICISLTGWSLRVEKVIKENPNNKIAMITTVNYKSKHKKLQVISLKEYFSDKNDNFEGYTSLRNIYMWIDDCLNIIHLKYKK